MTKKLYKLFPAAQAWDPNWDRAPSQGVVVVRANSPADARIVASEAEPDFLDMDAKPGDGASTRFASAFRDTKLYSVVEIDSVEFSVDGPREVVLGTIRNPLLKGSAS